MKAFRILFLYSNYVLKYAKNLLECSISIFNIIENFQELIQFFNFYFIKVVGHNKLLFSKLYFSHK